MLSLLEVVEEALKTDAQRFFRQLPAPRKESEAIETVGEVTPDIRNYLNCIGEGEFFGGKAWERTLARAACENKEFADG